VNLLKRGIFSRCRKRERREIQALAPRRRSASDLRRLAIRPKKTLLEARCGRNERALPRPRRAF